MVSDEQAEQLLDWIQQERIQVFYVRMPAEYGVVNGE